MMKRKKVISLLLAMTMLTTPCFAFAEDAAQQPAVTEAERITAEKLHAIGMIDEMSEEELLKVPTRRECASFMAAFLNLPVSDMPESSPFVDVAPGYEEANAILALYNMGMVSRGEELRFYPEQTVTLNEAVGFVVKAMGYKLIAESEGGYPAGYLSVANKYSLLEGISGPEIRVKDILSMLEKALHAPAFSYVGTNDGKEQYVFDKEYTILNDVWNMYEKKGIVDGNHVTGLKSADSHLGAGEVSIDGVKYIADDAVSDEMLGKAVTAYMKDIKDDTDEIVYIEENGRKNRTTILEYTEIVTKETTNSSVAYLENDKVKKLNLATNISVIYNGISFGNYYQLTEILPQYGQVEVIDNTGDDVADVLKISDYTHTSVLYTDDYETVIRDKANPDADLFYGDDTKTAFYFSETGKVASALELAYHDILTVSTSKDKKYIVAFVTRNTVKGTVEEVAENGAETLYTVNGKTYEAVPGRIKELKAGTQGTFYLDHFGRIAEYSGDTAVQDGFSAAVLAGVEKTDDLEGALKLKLFDANGKFTVAYVKDRISVDKKTYSAADKDLFGILSDNAGKLVRFRMSDDRIDGLDLAYVPNISVGQDTGDALGSLTQVCNGTSLRRRSNIFDMGNKNFYANASAATVYIVPTDLSEEEKYRVITPADAFANGHTYTASGTTGTYTHIVSNLQASAYNMGTEDHTCEVATSLVLRCDFFEVGNAAGNFMIVSKITDSYNEATGVNCKRIYFDGGASYKDVATNVTLQNDSSVTGFENMHIVPGDLITVSENKDGLISNIRVWYRMDQTSDKPAVLSKTKATDANYYDSQPVRGAAKVIAVDTAKKVVSYETIDGNYRWMMSYNSPTVRLIRTDIGRTNAVQSITPAAIRPGDTIVFYANLAACTTMIVYR